MMCCDYFSRHAFVILVAAIATAGKIKLSMFLLTLKAPITVAADGIFCEFFPNFRNKYMYGMIFY